MLTYEQASDKVIIALDCSRERAFELADMLAGKATWVKVGMTLFYAEGPAIVEAMRERGLRVFLDLKVHDIPFQVQGAVAAHGQQARRAPLFRRILGYLLLGQIVGIVLQQKIIFGNENRRHGSFPSLLFGPRGGRNICRRDRAGRCRFPCPSRRGGAAGRPERRLSVRAGEAILFGLSGLPDDS